MEQKLAYCGIDCAACPAYLATKNDDGKERERVAKEWSEMLDMEIDPWDINCEGCAQEDGERFFHCKVCEIRKCASKERKVKNCAFCGIYPCETMKDFFKKVPEARANLEPLSKKKFGH
ncbi:MAG: DUF3795 domain-containing protein [bacterium]|nr:DUF3795 domain-containing protein [bacterium]